ncbi:MAG: 16S rRNA (adenine(1518)-N(6)/adenine(1519)-N(6))-dimethyltransferase RsmA [bacterium]|nr:16S rRNA (adenine(1518)-N(6)/adenine(1519)-N(6))-dimethyltransferase RsmA [Candidatus Wildermuthbacteria bacterium]MDP2664365.1 16S rRNA (adenine(1518)-N(6)/adenine(1519)-N(6))-dimethyltransferase RsmA [bacterium]
MNTDEIKKLLKDQEIWPKKGLGQNFLVHKDLLQEITGAASLKKKDVVLEIGPGLGILTKALAKKAKRVVAVEKDPRMVDILLRTVAKEHPNVEIIEGDVLDLVKGSSLTRSRIGFGRIKEYKVVANLPYYITSPVIRMFLEAKVQPKVMVLMVQKEVAQRICAKPPEMSLLAVSVQAYAKPEIISLVSKNAFWPQPKVDSAILRITPLMNADKKLINADTFFRVVKAGFKHPRKQLASNLSKGLGLPKEEISQLLSQNGVEPTARAETLSVEKWLGLAKSIGNK